MLAVRAEAQTGCCQCSNPVTCNELTFVACRQSTPGPCPGGFSVWTDTGLCVGGALCLLPTATQTFTVTQTFTATRTFTPTLTPTPSKSMTPTKTPTPTSTEDCRTLSPTPTVTPTMTPCCCQCGGHYPGAAIRPCPDGVCVAGIPVGDQCQTPSPTITPIPTCGPNDCCECGGHYPNGFTSATPFACTGRCIPGGVVVTTTPGVNQCASPTPTPLPPDFACCCQPDGAGCMQAAPVCPDGVPMCAVCNGDGSCTPCTPTPLGTLTPTLTPTITPTGTQTPTGSRPPTWTPTKTPTGTNTFTPTVTPTVGCPDGGVGLAVPLAATSDGMTVQSANSPVYAGAACNTAYMSVTGSAYRALGSGGFIIGDGFERFNSTLPVGNVVQSADLRLYGAGFDDDTDLRNLTIRYANSIVWPASCADWTLDPVGTVAVTQALASYPPPFDTRIIPLGNVDQINTAGYTALGFYIDGGEPASGHGFTWTVNGKLGLSSVAPVLELCYATPTATITGTIPPTPTVTPTRTETPTATPTQVNICGVTSPVNGNVGGYAAADALCVGAVGDSRAHVCTNHELLLIQKFGSFDPAAFGWYSAAGPGAVVPPLTPGVPVGYVADCNGFKTANPKLYGREFRGATMEGVNVPCNLLLPLLCCCQ